MAASTALRCQAPRFALAFSPYGSFIWLNMKTLTVILLAGEILILQTRAEKFHFDDTKPGAIPPGWQVALTGKGDPKWSLVADDSAPRRPNVLKQSGEATYPLLIKTNSSLRDGFVQMKFKAISGEQDQAAGVIWRAINAADYYVCRANALENNVVLYKTVAGKRSSLELVGRKGGYGVEEKVAPGQWHALRVEFAGNRFKVFFNGKQLFEVEDNTFTEAGHVGLWTKADSATLFDDFECDGK